MSKGNNLLIFIMTVGVFGILTTEMGVVGNATHSVSICVFAKMVIMEMN
jgi:hypothetical protein